MDDLFPLSDLGEIRGNIDTVATRSRPQVLVLWLASVHVGMYLNQWTAPDKGQDKASSILNQAWCPKTVPILSIFNIKHPAHHWAPVYILLVNIITIHIQLLWGCTCHCPVLSMSWLVIIQWVAGRELSLTTSCHHYSGVDRDKDSLLEHEQTS